MAPPSNTPGLQLGELSLDSRPRDVSDAFLLSSATFFQFHAQTNVISELCHKRMGEMKAQCLLYSQGYRALHSGRKALIGQQILSSDWLNFELLRSDWSTDTLL